MSSKEYTLFFPDISAPRGETLGIVNELVQSWREGKNDGGSELAAVAALLSTEDILPYIAYCPRGDSPITELCRAFAGFLGALPLTGSEFLSRVLKDRKLTEFKLHITAFGSATGALFSALTAAGVSGNEVITTSLNYIGVINAIFLAGATPKFVDIEDRSWCMDPAVMERAITKKTKAVILTHLNKLVDLEPFYDIFKRRGLEIPLIQDASLAVGSTCHGVRPGVLNIGEQGVTVISLATSKTISGLGGAVAAGHNQVHMEKMFEIAYQGMSFKEMGAISFSGTNAKMNEINAVIAIEQLKRRDKIFVHRKELKADYDKHLLSLAKAGKLTLQNVGKDALVTHYGVLLPDRNQLALRLYEKHHIHLGMWHSYHQQEIYRRMAGSYVPGLPKTEEIANKIAFLPFHTRLTGDDVKFICGVLAEELG